MVSGKIAPCGKNSPALDAMELFRFMTQFDPFNASRIAQTLKGRGLVR